MRHQIDDLEPDGGDRILIDEIQRVPKLLDIVHSLMERRPDLQFILCGSSARKLRHGASNLLGGRALYRTMHPCNP
ncbi:MAG: AAA family ATPase [Desulfobacteraceae bacterium]|nr:AAA family ATPase [Desulfobacteraceae bacterium]MBC2718787.1 AAA family ATPase [Desulfobacteraceae bacterium]